MRVIGGLMIAGVVAACSASATDGATVVAVESEAVTVVGAPAKPPPCPPELTYCGTGGDGNSVCCGAKSNCTTVGGQPACGEQQPTQPGCFNGTFRCGTTCCVNGDSCDVANNACVSACPAGAPQCPVPGGCCASNEQCNQVAGGYACNAIPPTGRCTAPQQSCGTDPNAPAPATRCCNPGLLCNVISPTMAGCCAPGFASNAQGKCIGLGPTCGKGTAPLGATCCNNTTGLYCFAGQTCNAQNTGCLIPKPKSAGVAASAETPEDDAEAEAAGELATPTAEESSGD